MTPTRAALERLIETGRKEAKQLRAMAEAELHNLDFRDEWDTRARELDRCADELAALLTSEGPAPTLRDFVFSCPACGDPAARTIEVDVDIHSGAMYRCDQCGEKVVFEVEPAEGPETPADTTEGR